MSCIGAVENMACNGSAVNGSIECIFRNALCTHKKRQRSKVAPSLKFYSI